MAFRCSFWGSPLAQLCEYISLWGCGTFVWQVSLLRTRWAPLSEMFGRRAVFIPTYFALTAFNAGTAGAQSMPALLVLRFLGGAFGSNSLVSAGAIVADEFPARQRGLALAYYGVTPYELRLSLIDDIADLCSFLGPTLGPILGGFVGETLGWRWVEGIIAILTGTLGIVYTLAVPETYAPAILRKRAQKLSLMNGMTYKYHMELQQGSKKPGEVLLVSMSRPWTLLFCEPIVAVLGLYQAVVYATLYLCFGEFERLTVYPLLLTVECSCVSNRLSTGARMVCGNWWPGLPRCDYWHDLDHPVQYLEQQTICKAQ